MTKLATALTSVWLTVNILAHVPVAFVSIEPGVIDLVADLEHLVQICDGFDKPGFEPSDACREQLDKYFMVRPIWINPTGVDNLYRSVPHVEFLPPLSPQRVSYGHVDMSIEEIPVWRHILDGKFRDRIDVVRHVFEDPNCSGLRGSDEIRADLAEQCQSEELFKFAAFLEGCLAGLDRARRWIGLEPSHLDRSHFDTAKESLTGTYETLANSHEVSLMEVAAQFTHSTLQAAWMSQHCRPIVLPQFDEELKAFAMHENSPTTRDITINTGHIVRIGHDAALEIAAMSGNEWAMHRFWPATARERIRFLRAVIEHKPLLVHHYLAASLDQLSLTGEERRWHAVKEYSLARAAEPDLGLSLEEYITQELSGGIATNVVWMLGELGVTEEDVLKDQALVDSRIRFPWEQESVADP